jgi:hypothetical protein
VPVPALFAAGGADGSAFLSVTRRSHSAASSGVKNGLSFNSGGRSSGVAVAEFQMPSKFGWVSAPVPERANTGSRASAARHRQRTGVRRVTVIFSIA